MSERLPASLAYLLIYNPTLPVSHNVPRDDEDAQEEAHILFYTSRDRVVSRDRMLRQVGLAKALVNFSETFTPDQGCDSVHSQGKRMISVSPEPDFWMHVCVDLAKTQKPNKSKVVKKTDLPPPVYYYHEESVHDLALRNYLLKGYESFKLLHGTYSSMMKESDPGTLERHLEHFFTPWAWHWDFEDINEFGAHLGLPIHPLNRSLSSLLASFMDTLPANAFPILLSPPYIIDSSISSVAPYPSSLARYLLSLTSSSGRSTSNFKPMKSQKSPKGSGHNSYLDVVNISTSNNTLGFLSSAGAGMGEVINIKKWSWPGALMFGKTGSSRHNLSTDMDVHTSGTQKCSANEPSVNASTTIVNEYEPRNTSRFAPAIKNHIQGEVDHSALDDAISSLATCEVGVLMEGDSRPDSEAFHSAESQTNVPPSDATSLPDNAVSNASRDTNVPPLSTTFSQSTNPNYSILSVFLSEPSQPLVVRRRHVLHVSLFQLGFALVMDAECPTDGLVERFESLTHKVSAFLEKVRKVIDADYKHKSNGEAVDLRNGTDQSKHFICSPHCTIFSNSLSSTTSSLFFESQQTLARDPDVREIFSRSTTSQQWFVARRNLALNSAADKLPGEAYLQTNNKEASLVDADNELLGVLRWWAQVAD